MIVIRDNERLYLHSWEYNAARIISRLAVIVENDGGRVKPCHPAIISDRTREDARREYSEKLEHLEDLERNTHNEKRAEAIAEYRSRLDAIGTEDPDPITVTHTSYISFILNDTYYYYQVESNPFFEFYYQKTPIKDGKRSKDAYLTEDPKDWLFDCFLRMNCSEADIKEAAQLIYNMLLSAKNSGIHREGRRCRVSNTYNSGYHYETIYTPERFEKIDF